VAVLSMSKQEFSRLDVRLRFQSGRLRVTDACVLISLQRRQVFRLSRGLIGMTQRRQLPLGTFEYPPLQHKVHNQVDHAGALICRQTKSRMSLVCIGLLA
jgi:hypothetical protein